MNNKTSPNEIRTLLRRMRGEEEIPIMVNEDLKKSKPTFIDTVKIMRRLNEFADNLVKNYGVREDVDAEPIKPENKRTIHDQKNEEEKFLNFFGDEVNVDFIELEVYDNLVFWGGTINGIIQFIYKVTPNEATNGVEFNYLDGFNPDNPNNDEIIKKVESYFNTFYEYWIDGVIQKSEKDQ